MHGDLVTGYCCWYSDIETLQSLCIKSIGLMSEDILSGMGNGFNEGGRVLSRIFCLGGSRSLKKFLEPRRSEKNFRPSGGSGGMLPRKILKR